MVSWSEWEEADIIYLASWRVSESLFQYRERNGSMFLWQTDRCNLKLVIALDNWLLWYFLDLFSAYCQLGSWTFMYFRPACYANHNQNRPGSTYLGKFVRIALLTDFLGISVGRFGPDLPSLVKVTARAWQASHAAVFHFGLHLRRVPGTMVSK